MKKCKHSSAMDPTYPLAPIANFIACTMILFALFVNVYLSKSWNFPVSMFALWTAVSSIATGVNAIIWSDNVKNIAPVWCDISK